MIFNVITMNIISSRVLIEFLTSTNLRDLSMLKLPQRQHQMLSRLLSRRIVLNFFNGYNKGIRNTPRPVLQSLVLTLNKLS